MESGAIDLSAFANYLDVPKRFQRRRSSGSKSPFYCVHCQCADEYERLIEAGKLNASTTTTTMTMGDSDASLSDDDDDDETDDSEHTDHPYTTSQYLTIPLIVPQCNINVSLATTDSFALPTTSVSGDDTIVASTTDQFSCDTLCDNDTSMPVPQRSRRRSISRQEAVFVEPTGTSLENLDTMKTPVGSTEHIARLTRNNEHSSVASNDSNDYVQDFYLTVPEADLRRDRAASVDSSFSKLSSNGMTEELQPVIDGFLSIPTNAVRSRSVDIVLPTDEQARYKALSLAGPSSSKRYVPKFSCWDLCTSFLLCLFSSISMFYFVPFYSILLLYQLFFAISWNFYLRLTFEWRKKTWARESLAISIGMSIKDEHCFQGKTGNRTIWWVRCVALILFILTRLAYLVKITW